MWRKKQSWEQVHGRCLVLAGGEALKKVKNKHRKETSKGSSTVRLIGLPEEWLYKTFIFFLHLRAASEESAQRETLSLLSVAC